MFTVSRPTAVGPELKISKLLFSPTTLDLYYGYYVDQALQRRARPAGLRER